MGSRHIFGSNRGAKALHNESRRTDKDLDKFGPSEK
jgi:hypothetical protein